ncbi:MAG: hypothetical protein Q4G26_08590 [Paracoccus sp. (in: a-proteobacteria)]|nr:hypothetical protein [Paracoccus sp. (in: a-proteobacteria)]
MFDFLARANRAEDPGGYILRYKDGACDLSLPAGRAVAIDHNAGFFTLLTSTLPMTPLSFDEVMDLSNAIARKFEQAGWPRISHNTIEQDGFGAYSLGGKLEISGEWRPCDDPNLYASVIVKYFNSLPSGPHIPPVPGNVLPDDYPDRYLIQVDIGIDDKSLYDEVIALRDARRIAENGSKDAALSLKDWIDDPDWHPQGWRGRFIK